VRVFHPYRKEELEYGTGGNKGLAVSAAKISGGEGVLQMGEKASNYYKRGGEKKKKLMSSVGTEAHRMEVTPLAVSKRSGVAV